jgi:ABC-2 type transport system permease protein
VFVAVNCSVWFAIYDYNSLDTLNGFTLEEMLNYQAWNLVVTYMIRSHRSSSLSDDIRLGKITSFLVYPFEFWRYYYSSYFGFQMIQVIVAIITILVLYSLGLITNLSPSSIINGFLFSLSVGVLWCTLEFLAGTAAFWLEETWVFRYVLELTAVLLSGAIIPITFFPEMLQKILVYTPFPYLGSIPIQIFSGTYENDILLAYFSIIIWISIFSYITKIVWKKGVNLYTGAGM